MGRRVTRTQIEREGERDEEIERCGEPHREEKRVQGNTYESGRDREGGRGGGRKRERERERGGREREKERERWREGEREKELYFRFCWYELTSKNKG